RDDGLVAEGLEQRDLFVQKQSGLESVDNDHANRGATSKYGHGQEAPDVLSDCEWSPVLGIQANVRNLSDDAAQDCAPRDVAGARRHGVGRLEDLEPPLRKVVMRHEVDEFPVEAEHCAVAPIA